MARTHGAGAASVVTQLLAFLREPARYRPQFTIGRCSLDGGHHVFRIAQGKFPLGLAHDVPTHEREELRRAAVAFIREVCFWEGATHYQMLCVPPHAKREDIKENYHLMMALIHPDRAEGSSDAWPADWAQRVNRAYAVLADAPARTSYDQSMRVADSIPPFPPRPPRRRGGPVAVGRIRLAKALLVLSAVAATLLLLEIWARDPPDERFSFKGLADVSRYRDLAAGAERPRYLGANVLPARANMRDTLPPAEDTRSFAMLAPLWRNITETRAVDTLPARLPPSAQARAPTLVPEPESESPVAGRADDVVAKEVPAQAPVRTAQAQLPPPAAAQPRLTSEQIEMVVARLIGYYEAGETDNLMGLLDAQEAGFWRTTRTRQIYLDFFRATRQRRLRVKELDWQTAALSAHARGQATVQAEYLDAPDKFERDIEVEMDIVLRNGQAKITRLSLFPNVP